MPQDKLPEPGEFTRIFKRQHFGAQGEADAEKSPSEAPGAFTAADAPLQTPSTEQPIPPPAPAPAEAGEFTQYFKGGLPPSAAKSGTGASHRAPAGVQRPSTPVPQRTLATDRSGSFTGHFGNAPAAPVHRADDFGVPKSRIGPPPDLSEPLSEESGPFDFKPRIPQASPSSQDGPSEYTKLFGPGSAPPLPRQLAVAQAPLASLMSDSPNSARSVPMAAPDVPAAAMQRGPSEFPVVANGKPAGAPAANASPAAGANNAMEMPKMPPGVNLSPINPLPSIAGGAGLHSPSPSGAAGMSGAHASTPIGSANLKAPSVPSVPPVKLPAGGAGIPRLSDQSKLILFFAVLAILAVILVVALVATQKN